MKKIALALAMFSLAACGASKSKSSVKSQGASHASTTVSFAAIKAGVEYPSDSPRPASLENKKVLVIANPEIPGEKSGSSLILRQR